VLNFILIGPLAHAGLALSSAIASILNVLVLLFALMKQKIYVPVKGWAGFSFRLL
jgi:putative peptidoglycan lipid II flippase